MVSVGLWSQQSLIPPSSSLAGPLADAMLSEGVVQEWALKPNCLDPNSGSTPQELCDITKYP